MGKLTFRRRKKAVLPSMPPPPPAIEAATTSKAPVKKKAGGARLWMRMDRLGQSELIECDKSVIIKRVSIPARDLRILGPIFSHSSSILGKSPYFVFFAKFCVLGGARIGRVFFVEVAGILTLCYWVEGLCMQLLELVFLFVPVFLLFSSYND